MDGGIQQKNETNESNQMGQTWHNTDTQKQCHDMFLYFFFSCQMIIKWGLRENKKKNKKKDII